MIKILLENKFYKLERTYTLSSVFCLLFSVFCLLFSISCTSDQFSSWNREKFDLTPITMSTQKTIYLKNPDDSKEQHVMLIGFDKGSNASNHFQLDSVIVGDEKVSGQDILIPPGSTLGLKISYAPQNMETTYAKYGGWETGKPESFLPGRAENIKKEKNNIAIHRSIMQIVYDYPTPGIVQVEVVGEAIEGPNGEIAIEGPSGECNPGNGIGCYDGGFAIDIPQLYPGGPRELELAGKIKFSVDGGEIKLKMDDLPPSLMILRSTEIPDLPSGVNGTIIISGSPGEIATGTFDGSRISLSDVAFRIRFVLGELTKEDVAEGTLAAMVDFIISDLEITTTEPLNQQMITMHLETTLPEDPSGNPLFDQFLGNANVILVMDGEFVY